MSDWQTLPLGKISILGPQYGANAKAIDWSGLRPRYIRITDIDESGNLRPDDAVEADIDDESEFILEEGDLLFARSGNTVGKSYRYSSKDGRSIFAGYMIRFRVNPALADSRYVFYFTQSSTYSNWVLSKKRVAGQPNINGTEYSSLKIPLPSPPEQRRIVEILDQADALRKLRREADQLAERILPALFYKMFGDPVRNEKGLTKKKLGDLIRVKSGEGVAVKSLHPTEGYPVYGGNGINGYHTEFMFENPVVVIGRVGVYCGAVYYSKPKCWVTDNALYVAEKSEELLDRYLTEALRMANLNQYAGRAGQPLISGSRIYPIEILVPSIDKQKEFGEQVEMLEEQAYTRTEAKDNLEKLFSVLLHRAFTGELTKGWRETRNF
ncbi:MAG: restriction endonuclease subunit S [Bacteroidetes bacterium]|nr:restriction endonuclease subunit S [Bacteroidota bacterium]MCW5896778.1 restriction endonuclease subunit S [Bacteroidota bacterium]